MSNQNIKICKIHILDSFYPDTTGQAGFQNIQVNADILYSNKVISMNLADVLDLHDSSKFDIWADLRHRRKYSEITYNEEQEAINNFRTHLHEIYNLENVQRYIKRLVNECEYYIENSEYNDAYVVKSKETIENEIARLQEQLSYFN